MTTTTLTLSAFLEARIAEDEAAFGFLRDGTGTVYICDVPLSPHRMLAECAAKRRIVERHEPMAPDSGALHICHDGLADDSDCVELRALASVYADHPDYRDEWKP